MGPRSCGTHIRAYTFSSSFLRDKGHLQALKFKHPPLFILLALERNERLGAIEDAPLFHVVHQGCSSNLRDDPRINLHFDFDRVPMTRIIRSIFVLYST